jgi:hypothetical protein
MENDKIQFGYRNEKLNNFINMQLNILRKVYNVSYTKEDICYLDIARIMYKTKLIHYLLLKNMISASNSNYFITSISDISNTLLLASEYECHFQCQYLPNPNYTIMFENKY